MMFYNWNQIEKTLNEAVKATRRKADRASELARLDVKPHIAEVYYPLHEDIQSGKHEFYNLTGGRGSGKSSFCALEIVSGIMKDPSGKANGLVVRKWAVTLRGSVYSQIQWAIDTLGVSDRWKSTVNPLQFIYETGQVIKLTGLDDPQKLKSIKPTQGYFKYLWMEEFSEINGEMELRNLQQSVLRGGERFTVFRSFNPPISVTNWANVYVTLPDDRAVTLHTNYTMIPPEWLGQSFIDEAERLKAINERAYCHEYLGEAIGSGGEVFPNIETREITEEEVNQLQYIYCGVDFGFSSDPCVCMRVAYDRKHETIYFLGEIYQKHLSNKGLADRIKEAGWDRKTEIVPYNPFLGYGGEVRERQVIYCDSAEPKSIADLQSEGIRALSCTKYPGCVEYRVKWLQQRKLVIDPKRTPNAHREFSNYEYEADKQGNFLPSLPDKDNHSIDSLAYALNNVIHVRGASA